MLAGLCFSLRHQVRLNAGKRLCRSGSARPEPGMPATSTEQLVLPSTSVGLSRTALYLRSSASEMPK